MARYLFCWPLVLLQVSLPFVFMIFVVCRSYFSKSTFKKKSFMDTIKVSKSLDPYQARHFVGPDMGPNWLQRSLADDTSR